MRLIRTRVFQNWYKHMRRCAALANSFLPEGNVSPSAHLGQPRAATHLITNVTYRSIEITSLIALIAKGVSVSRRIGMRPES